MKLGVACLMMAACWMLGGCAAQETRTGAAVVTEAGAATDPWMLPQYEEYPLETEQAAKDFGQQMAKSCLIESLIAYSKGWPADADTKEVVDACARRKISTVVDDPVGDKVCAGKSAFEDYLNCMMMGAILSHLRGHAGGPSKLDEKEWRDREFATQNLANELLVQAYAKCTTGDAKTIERCQYQAVNSSLGLPAADVAYCQSRANYMMSCLIDKSVAKFMRDAALRLWN